MPNLRHAQVPTILDGPIRGAPIEMSPARSQSAAGGHAVPGKPQKRGSKSRRDD